ncbi:MAG: NAD(P)/FAD-dependent oxidoreductase [Chloroflexota bacterium]
MKKHEVIIIGAGPAGMAAAIQLKRFGITPLVFEQKRVGGLLWNANLVENYPGFPGGISGAELVAGMIAQLKGHQLGVTEEKVYSVDFQANQFVIESQKGDYISQALIIASGTKPNQFPENFIPKKVADRVRYEVADLAGVAGEQILIVGAGDAAFDYAINLAKENDVVILNRGSEIKALPLLQERVSANPKIRYLENSRINCLRQDDGGLVVELEVPEGGFELHCGYLLGAIGRSAALPSLSDALHKEMKGLQKEGLLQIIGDVKNGIFRQTSIAVGDGVMAAMKIYGNI